MSKGLTLTLKLVITVGILMFIFNRIPVADVAGVIAKANPVYYALAIVTCLLQRLLMGWRTRILAWHQSMTLSTSQLVTAGFVATFYGFFLPGSMAGGAVRWYKLNKIVSMPSEVLVMIAFDRMIDTVFLVALGLCFFLLDDRFMGDKSLGVDLAMAFILLLVVYILAFNSRVSRFFLSIILSFGFLPDVVKQKLQKLIDVVVRFGEMSFSRHIQLFFLSIANYSMGVLAFWLLSHSLRLDLSFITLGWITSAVTAIAMLPITFSGLGVREAGVVVMLEPFGISAASALAFSLLIFTTTVALAMAGGVLEFREQYFGTKKIKRG